MLAKLYPYGFGKMLNFIHAYLSQRKQKTKVGSAFSDLLNILFGVPQGSVLGPLLLIIFICDLFILNDDIELGSYVDDTPSFVSGETFEQIVSELEEHMASVSE